MSDWDALEADAAASSYTSNVCGVGRLLAVVGEKHGAPAAASVVRTLANVRLSAPSIRKALESRVDAELLPSISTLHRHRNGGCSCPKEAS